MVPPPANAPASSPSARGPDDLPVELVIHRRVCLTAAIVTLFLIAPLSGLLRISAMVWLSSAAFGLVMLGFYVAARHRRFPLKVTFALTLSMIALCWFPASGTNGSALLYQSAALVYAVIVFRGGARVWAVTSLVALTLSLIGLESEFPGLVPPVTNVAARSIQLAAGVTAATVLSGLVLVAVVSAYDRERQHLGSSLRALHDSQHELAGSRATLAALINSALDMVWLVDPHDCSVTQCNAAFAEFGRRYLSADPTTTVTLTALFPPEEAEVWRGYCRRALEEGPFTTEHTSQSQRTLLVSVGPVSHDGTVLGVSFFAHDITNRRAQEAARAEMERRLLQAQKMEGLGRLAGGVAHDFNNMLSAILGYAEILRDNERDPDRIECLTAIERAAQRSGELTRKLLAFGRRGKNVIEPVALKAIVEDCLVMLTPSLRADVHVEHDLRDTWTVDGDRSQLSQVVLNLCLNANEAMPRGGTLRVATRDRELVAGDPSSGVVELVVSDTGVGMSDETKSRIFEPFYTTKPEGLVSGTGLGLATVDGVLTLHGGTVSVVSAPERGSTFTVQLPRGRLPASPPSTQVPRSIGRGAVLVVDDEPLVRQMAASALQTLGYRAIVAADGQEGIEQFTQHHDTLLAVVLDLKMPRMGGADAFAAMRRIDARVPVLICTGYGDNEEVQALIRDGARGLVMKPFTLHEFGSALASLR